MDTSNGRFRLHAAGVRVRHCVLYKLYCDLLSCVQGDSVRNDGEFSNCHGDRGVIWLLDRANFDLSLGCGHVYLFVCYSAVDAGGYRAGEEFGRTTGLSMSYKRCAASHSGEEVVYGARCDYTARRCTAVR